MKTSLLYLVMAVVAFVQPLSIVAQDKNDREQWMNELRQYRRAYFIKELDLSREQQDRFFPLYEELEELMRKVDEESRVMERRVAEAGDATDLEYEKAAEAMYEAKLKEATMEKDYMEKFKEIISPRQLFMLKAVERQFSREMMKQHHRIRSLRNAEEK